MKPKTKVVIAIVNGLSGVMAWAYRLKRAFFHNSHYELCLMGCRASKEYGDIDLYAPNLREAQRILRCMDGAIVVPNFLFDLFDVCANLIRGGHQLRTVGFCRADDAQEYYEPLHFYQNVVSHFVAVSDRCADRLAAYLPERRKDISVLPTGVDYPGQLLRTYSGCPIEIVYGGRLEQRQKRILDLVALVRLLLERSVDFRLSIAGGGRQSDELQQGINELPHQGRVQFLGRLPYEQMTHLWRSNDVFVQLSEYEGTSNSMLEAMAQGTIPIVTETDSGSRSVIEEGENGFLVPIGDMNAMADRIAGLADWRGARLQAMGRRTYESVKPYAMQCYVGHFIDMLNKATASPPPTFVDGFLFPAHSSFGLPLVP